MEWKIALEFFVNSMRSFDTLKKKVNREDEFMSHLWNKENIREFLNDWLKHHCNDRESKSVAKAQAFKALGNKEFQAKNYVKSIELYTKCALYAPANSSELPIAFANRSASLFYLNRYADSIKDIELAFKLNYPEHLRYKLYLRAAQCYSKLGKEQLAEETISIILELIDSADYITSSVKDNIKSKINELTFMKPYVENDSRDTDNISKVKSRIVFEENTNIPYASVTIDKKYNKEFGKHVIANRFIKKGDVLFLEKPLCFALVDRNTLSVFCQYCKRSITDIPVPCATCLNTLYCNETCLTEAWSSYHCWECPGNQMELWKGIGIGYLALKILLTCSTTMDAIMFNEMQNLVTNSDKVFVRDLASYGITAIMLTIYLSNYTNYFETNNLEECLMNKFLDTSFNSKFNILTDNGKELYVSCLLLRHIRQVACNGFAITESEPLLDIDLFDRKDGDDIVGTGMYVSASMMNHSCDPNVINIFVDRYLIVRASKDIAEGEEVFACYGPYYKCMSVEERQEILESRYCFTCKCNACTTPRLQYFPERFNGMKCRKCNGALCNIKNSVRCLDCDDNCEAHFPNEINQAKELFAAAEALFVSRKMVQALDKLKKCLRIQKGILYKHNYDIVLSLDFMAEIYKKMGRYLDSAKCSESTLSAFQERYELINAIPLNKIINIIDTYFKYLENESNTATDTYKNILRKTEKYLDQAEEIVDFSYGSWSKVYEYVKTKRGKFDLLCKVFQ